MKKSKNYKKFVSEIDRDLAYQPKDAIEKLKSLSFAKFDETIECHFNLGIDPRHSDQQLRGSITLPNGTGKTVKICAIVSEAKINDAKNAGADYAGSADIIEKIKSGWFDFDLVLATPDMMAKVGQLGRVLGTKGLMPNPKSGTVSNDIVKAIKDFKFGKTEYKNDKNGIIHLGIGKISFSAENIYDNFETVYDQISKIKPAAVKGTYIKSISLATTMGCGIFVETQKNKWTN